MGLAELRWYSSCTTRLKIAYSSWGTSSVAFLILKGACGSCAAQLPFSSVRSQKAILKKKAVTSKTQNVFSSTPSWQNGSAWARACVTHNANPKWIAPPYIVCMYVVKAWVTQIKHLIFTFRHEINQVHWLFLKNKIFTPQAPLHSLVMRYFPARWALFLF